MGFGGSDRSAVSTAALLAVGQHPFGVFGAFTGFFPFGALIVAGVFVFAQSFSSDSGAASGVSLTSRATRLHTVGDHPGGVGGTLRGVLCGPSFASVTCSVAVGFAEGFVGVGGASLLTHGVFTSADRAARFGTVDKHPVGVGSALFVFGPDRTPRSITVSALGFVGRTQFGSLGFLCFLGSFFFSFFDIIDTFFVHRAFKISFVQSSCAFSACEFVFTFGTWSFSSTFSNCGSTRNDAQ